jgi:hypothetical protein
MIPIIPEQIDPPGLKGGFPGPKALSMICPVEFKLVKVLKPSLKLHATATFWSFERDRSSQRKGAYIARAWHRPVKVIDYITLIIPDRIRASRSGQQR